MILINAKQLSSMILQQQRYGLLVILINAKLSGKGHVHKGGYGLLVILINAKHALLNTSP